MNYPGAIQDPAPAWKQGYSAYPSPQPKKEGVVIHSMVGSFTAARSRLMGSDQASWHFSITKAGVVYQHYSPLAVNWHCGSAGDNLPLSASIGNVALIGIEMEGGPIGNVSEPWTQAQYDSVLNLLVWIWNNVPGIKPPALRSSLWEHTWLSATSCPSGRDPWVRLVPDLIARLENDMPLNDADKQWIWDTIVNILRAPEFGVNLINVRVAAMQPKVDLNHSILFDSGNNDGAADLRRLIYIGNNVKKITSGAPLTDTQLAAIAKAVNDDAARRGAS